MADKTIEQWEREKGYIVQGDINLGAKLSEQDFLDLAAKNGVSGVNFADREKFLEDNGYPITRENLVNPELSARPQE